VAVTSEDRSEELAEVFGNFHFYQLVGAKDKSYCTRYASSSSNKRSFFLEEKNRFN
jgi:hypothetical protein